MSRELKLEHETLSWVKKELDAVLDQARQALESFIDHPDDSALLIEVQEPLRQVSGTLQMVELYGAAMLAQEMQELTLALIHDAIRNREEALEVLLRAILQLPDYLEHIEAGNRDVPIVLLPLLNDLRTARDASLLSEKVLFFPDIAAAAPGSGYYEPAATVDIRELAKRLRHNYQVGLLGWFRGQDTGGSLAKLKAVSLKLYEASWQPTSRRLWWTTAALADALRIGALEPNVTVKSLLGKVDREIKRLGEQGEEAFAALIPEELSKNILYYVAYADDLSDLIKQVKQVHGLNQLLPHGQSLRDVQDRIAGPNLAILNTVSEAVREDLAVVRDSLELFVSGGAREPEKLETVARKLHTIADTLSMLGLNGPAAKTVEQARALTEIAGGKASATEAALTNVASAMLDVEIAIDHFGAARAASAVQGPAGPAVPPAEEAVARAEHLRILAAVVSEALRDLERAKEAINDFVRAPGDNTGRLAELPAYLDQVTGAMSMAHAGDAPALLASISRYVSSRLLTGQATQDDLEPLADAITSVEYILESLGKGARIPYAVLEIGRASVARLGFPVDAPEGLDADQAAHHPSGWTGINSAFAALATGREAGQAGATNLTSGLTAINTGSAAAAASESRPQPVSEPQLSHPSHIAPISAAPEGDRANLVALTGEADDEILEIFIEEAQEELAVIDRLLPQWRENASDREALTTVRRSLHTLKGSGRLVGAQMLGEFGWAFENLLNRVIDGTLPASEHIHEALAQVPDALAQLIAQLKGDGAPRIEVFALMETAHAMSKPDYNPISSPAQPQQGAVADAIEPDIQTGAAEERQPRAPEPAEIRHDPADGKTQIWPAQDISLDEATRRPGSEPAGSRGAQPGSDDVTRVLAFPSLGSPGAFEIEDITFPSDPLVGDAAAFEQPQAPTPSAPAPHQDQVLLDVFTNEAEQHLNSLEPRVEAALAAGAALPVSGEVLRTLHTLNGSARTAGVPEIARLCAPLEHYAAARAAMSQPIPADAAAVVMDGVQAVRGVLEALRTSSQALPDHGALRARIDSLLQEELARQTARPDFAPVGDSVDVLIMNGEAEENGDEADARRDAEVSDSRRDAPAELLAEDGPVDEALASEIVDAAAGMSAESAAQQDRELVEIFFEEARDLMDASDRSMQLWQGNHGDRQAVIDLQRQLHTLKGGARMAGCLPVGDLSHALESVILSVVEGRTRLIPPLFGAMHRGFDRLHAMLEQAEKFQTVAPAPELIALLDDLRENRLPVHAGAADLAIEPDRLEPQSGEGMLGMPAPAAEAAPPRAVDTGPAAPAQRAAPAARVATPQELIRVSSELLDNLVNSAGEVNIYHSRLEQQMTAFKFNLKELEQTVARLRDQLRKLEIETETQILFRYEQEKGELDGAFDPLELDRYSTMQQLSRALSESVNDLVSIKEILLDYVRGSETLLLQQSRVSTDLQEGLMRTRMVQFTGMAPRLRRIVRQTADELGKKVELRISGENNELDRSVLDRMVAPLEHMLRNAISHGIEGPGERRAKGKPETGQVRVGVAREANEVVIKVEDDGGGVDLEAVRAKACSLGMMTDDDRLSSHEIMQFILEPGFSTAETVTQISGRGVGMDVVSSEIKQLGGMLSIDSTRGKGTSFTIRLPFTLAINQALLVQSGEDIYAVPLTSIEGVVRLSAEELRRKYADAAPAYEYAANQYELRHLGALLGRCEPVLSEAQAMYPLMLVKAGERRVALQVEGLLGNREVVVKPVGPQISKVRGISGATILGDGRVVLILDLASLVRGVQLAYSSAEAPKGKKAGQKAGTVMVVDDSITIRKVTSRMLERNNFAVLTAKDGVDAVTQLQDNLPDLLLLDIEMPRMDGYELAMYVRSNEHLRDIPMIMITSRTGEKHRQRAMQIGVNRYLGKPYQEGELLDNIKDVLAMHDTLKSRMV